MTTMMTLMMIFMHNLNNGDKEHIVKDISPHLTKRTPIDDDNKADDDDDDDDDEDDDDDQANDDDDDNDSNAKPFQGWTGVPISQSIHTLRR